jgi:hypothetical protein
MEASLTKVPDGKTVIECLRSPFNRLSDNGNGGQRFNFQSGDIISLDNNTPPVVIYGKIRGYCLHFVIVPRISSSHPRAEHGFLNSVVWVVGWAIRS